MRDKRELVETGNWNRLAGKHDMLTRRRLYVFQIFTSAPLPLSVISLSLSRAPYSDE